MSRNLPTLNAAKTMNDLEDDQIHHVYPTFAREHITDKRTDCWCRPAVEFVEGGAIIIHEVEQ